MICVAPTLLMTRPKAASRAFVQDLRREGAAGFAVIVSPLIAIEVTGPLPDLSRYRGVIFTSAHAVAAFVALGGRSLATCFTVGAVTAKAATEAGFRPQSADADADALIALIADVRPLGPLLHLRGTHSRGSLAKTLSSAGIETDEAVIYDQPTRDLTPEARAALCADAPVIVPLFSPRTAARFAEVVPPTAAPWIVAMSPAVADALEKSYPAGQRPVRLCTSARPTGTEMRKTVAMLIDEARMLEGGKGAQ